MRWFSHRKYKSGTRWGFWLWTEVPSDFIRRLHIVKTPWFAICLHWLNAPDAEPYLHDHPVTFLSIILKGGYAERRGGYWYGKEHTRIHRWWNFIDATRGVAHRITEVEPGTVTLCFMGPKTREWGYHLPNGEWQHWKEYNAQKYPSQ